jgi:hypothetical protein
MTKTLIIATAAASLMAGTALAQNTAPADTAKPGVMPQQSTGADTKTNAAPGAATTGAASAGMSATGGIMMSKSASTPVKFATADTTDLMSSKLIGTNVYNTKNEKVGEIADLALDNGKTLSGVVLSVGGFLGLGESYVLVDPASLAVSNEDGTWKAFINTDKDSLKNAPKFTYKAANKKS